MESYAAFVLWLSRFDTGIEAGLTDPAHKDRNKLSVDWKGISSMEHTSLAIRNCQTTQNTSPHLESLDSLILGHAAAAVGAANNGCVATAVLGAAIVPALGRHLK